MSAEIHEGLLSRPRYAPADAGRLVGLRPDRVRRWLQGYSFTYQVETGEVRRGTKLPVLSRHAEDETLLASFLDLMDLLFVKRFVDKGIPLQKLRRALVEAKEVLDLEHFARQTFFSDGKSIYVQVAGRDEQAPALLELLSHGQWVIAPVIMTMADQIEFSDASGLASRWFPLGRARPVIVDPSHAFGAPSVLGKGVKTANVYDFFQAEGQNLEATCSWLDLTEDEVRAAVELECQLQAA